MATMATTMVTIKVIVAAAMGCWRMSCSSFSASDGMMAFDLVDYWALAATAQATADFDYEDLVAEFV